jgi:2-methylisocitrate lyase-like PEP mutase family enzyme
LAAEGFEAIATTSAGVAFALGKPDYGTDPRLAVSRDEMFDAMRRIVAAVRVPVNGDLEAGYGDSPEAVGETIRLAIAAGLAGGNIEDRNPRASGLYDASLAVERIAAAREAVAAAHSAFVLTARCDAFLVGCDEALATCIRRGNLYREAGADCLFTPGPSARDTVTTLVQEIRGPLNVVMGLGTASGNAHDLIAAGVQRISVGGSIARSALGLVRQAARELRDTGTLTYAAHQIPQAELNATFAAARTP